MASKARSKHHKPPCRDALRGFLLFTTLFLAVASARAQNCVQWVQRTDVGSLGLRYRHALAYDSDRGVTVFFGGEFNDSPVIYFDDTWEYDGTSWKQIDTGPTHPSVRSGHAMCYDLVRKEVVLVGGVNNSGYLNETWTYQSIEPGRGVWTERSSVPNQDPGHGFAGQGMVFDVARGRVVMAGGTLGNDSGIGVPGTDRSNLAWEDRGNGWSLGGVMADNLAGEYDGPTRHGMAYDSLHRTILLGGGSYYYFRAPVTYNVWIDFDDNSLRMISPGGSQGYSRSIVGGIGGSVGRQQLAMAYDKDRQRVVIFGGTSAGGDAGVGNRHDEATAFTYSNGSIGYSTKQLTIPTPPSRAGHAMVYDERRHVTVLMGGVSGHTAYGDTWELVSVPVAISLYDSPTQEQCIGGAVKFRTSANASSGWTLQWYHGDTPVDGDTNGDLTLQNLSVTDAGIYTLRAVMDCGSTGSSSPATLVVHTPPTIIEFDPVSERCPGQSAAFSVVADSALPITFQWLKDGGPIPGATSATLLLSGLRHDDTGDYQAVVSNRCGPTVSPSAHLQVGVTILANPQDTTAGVCQEASLSVVAHGAGPLRYLWRLDGVALTNNLYISGATNPLLNLAPLLYTHEGNYDVVITDDCLPINSVTSSVARLTILPGPQWVLRATNGPSARNFPALAYDSVRNVTVLFGGTVGFGGVYQPFGDLWEWNGARWTQRLAYSQTSGWTYVTDTGGWVPSYVNVPVPRHQHAMAFDSRRGRVVLFGGLSTDPTGINVPLGDTWEWDGLRWYLGATNGPSPRYHPAMAYDSGRGLTVMYGGIFGIPNQYDLVWEWNGQTWSSIHSTNTPFNDSAGMAYDSFRRTCFFGPSADNYFWNWDGTNWTRKSYQFTPALPSPRGGAMVFDAYRRRNVYFGGSLGFDTTQNETASWDDRSWTLLSSSLTLPVSRADFGMAYDGARHAVVLMGGDTNAFNSPLGDTWELVAVDKPLLNDQPASQYRQPNDTAIFAVTAVGPGILTYQWLRDGQPLVDAGSVSGSTSPTLTIARVTNSDAAHYSVRVSNDCGSTTSFPAILTLDLSVQVYTSSNAVTLEWGASNIVLEQADALAGPWTPVPGATSPFAVSAFPGSKFFRLHQTNP